MKYKKLMLVTFMLLAILTIGAVSASEDTAISDDSEVLSEDINDELTVDDSQEDLGENPSEENIAGDDAGGVLSYDASDFDVEINESMDLRYEDAAAITFDAPDGADGEILVGVNRTDSRYLFNLDDSPITLGDLWIEKTGTYSIYVYFSYTDDGEIYHEINLLNGTINVSQTIMTEDFDFDYLESDADDPIDDLSDDVFDLYDSPADGNLIVFVDNRKVYNLTVHVTDFEDDYIGITSEDLGIDGEDSPYHIAVIFNTTEGEEFTLADFNAYYDISDSQEPYISIYSRIIKEQIVPLAYISDDNSVNGTVTITIDGKKYYDKEFDGTSDYLFIHHYDLEGLDVFDKDFLGNHTVKVTYNNFTKESTVTFVFNPYFVQPYETAAGGIPFIVFEAPGDFTGVVSLYNVVYNIETDDYDITTSVLTDYPINASSSMVPLPALTAGGHIFFANYTIDGVNYGEMFGIYAVENSQNLSSIISAQGDSITVAVIGPKEGWIDFYVDGTWQAVFSMENGTVKYTFQGLTPGKHVIFVSYDNYGYNDLFYEKEYLVYVSDSSDITIITNDTGEKINVANAKVALSKTVFIYNAKVQKPTVTLSNGAVLKEGVDYTLQWSTASPKNAGTYTVTVTGIGAYTGTAKATFVINKAANPLKVKAKTVKVKFSKLKKKAQKLKVTKVVKFTKKGQGTLTYAKASGNKKITINKKTGKVTVAKGLKKGTYKVKVKIKAKGNANYMASAYKTVTFKIVIK